MTLQVRVSNQASLDADEIFAWIADRSWDGALRWYQRYLAFLSSLPDIAQKAVLVPEAETLGREVRQAIFKTRKGLPYRALFVIHAETIHVVGIRGPGQADATLEDLEFPV